MKISTIIKHVNRVVGKGSYTLDELIDYFDECIDDINVELDTYLPLMSAVYAYTAGTAFTLSEAELLLTYENNSEDNEYLRIPAEYLRNYMAYEAAYRILRDEDEDIEVLMPKQRHSYKWFQKLIAVFNDYTIVNSASISIEGDVDDVAADEVQDDTETGFYNPYFEYDDD